MQNIMTIKGKQYSIDADTNDVERIIDALEKPAYDWRTIDGISAEISLSMDKVEQILSKLQNTGIVVQSSKLDPKGRPMFTTWDHYKETQNIINRLVTAVSGQIK